MGFLITGEFLFGFLVGLMAGLSESAVVGTTLPLLFTFVGGSMVAFSSGDTMTSATHELLGKQLIGFSLGAAVGLAIGLCLRLYKKISMPIRDDLRKQIGKT